MTTDTVVVPPSPDQLRVIGYIETNTGVKFKGSGMQDAIFFIQDNLESSKKVYKKQRNPQSHSRYPFVYDDGKGNNVDMDDVYGALEDTQFVDDWAQYAWGGGTWGE